jgi:endoglucanase
VIRGRAATAAVACFAVLTLLVAACSDASPHNQAGGGTSPSGSPANPDDVARAAARRFLSTYVESDGRVARHDQGNDTVSEGQSYALLLAEVASDAPTVDKVWQWTSDHLLQPDGLLAAHARDDDQVDDANGATDADVVTAWALLRDTGDQASAHHDAGVHLATAVIDHETLTLPDGTMVLAAGNWATGSPGTLNPSYWALPALTALGRLTNDTRWTALAATTTKLTTDETDDGRQLPPDWERVDGGNIAPEPAPGGQAPDVRYSFDAQRVITWFAAGGTDSGTLAAKWAPLLDGDPRSDASALHLDGSVIDSTAHPSALVASAAAASAAGHPDVRDQRLAEAESLDAQHPTYYGSAWIALGRALLTTALLRS